MKNDIFFINTPIKIQEEIYYDIEEQLSRYDIPEDSIIYLKFTPITSFYGKFCFSVYIRNNIVDHSLLNYTPDFLIFSR